MISVAVLAGGTSDERDVSLRSGTAVLQALKDAGYQGAQLDSNCSDQDLQNHDVIFSVLHGKGGEDGTFQQRLDNLGLAYVGSDSAASSLTFDKNRYLEKMAQNNMPIPAGQLVDVAGYRVHSLSLKPHVLKPYDGGSSIDTFIVRQPANKPVAAIEAAFKTHDKLLLEELIEGTEITVGILENEALPVIEIIPPSSGEFDYVNKYNGATQELCPPHNVSPAAQQKAQDLALQVRQLMGCRDLSRTDMFVRPDDSIVILETNTLPGMTATSLFPKMAAQAGYDMPGLVDMLVKMALSRAGTDDAYRQAS